MCKLVLANLIDRNYPYLISFTADKSTKPYVSLLPIVHQMPRRRKDMNGSIIVSSAGRGYSHLHHRPNGTKEKPQQRNGNRLFHTGIELW